MEDNGILRIMKIIYCDEDLPKEKDSNMRSIIMTCLIITMLLLSGCYGKITGTVVDAETGKPIDGAVVLAEWTKTKGLGLTHTEVYKVIEKLADKDGKVTIEGVSDVSVNPPGVTVYKKGYVAWNNEYIFPGYKKRTDFKWKNGYIYKLERFKPEYSYVEHDSFVRGAIHSSLGLDKKQLFMKIYDEGERRERINERNKKMKRADQK